MSRSLIAVLTLTIALLLSGQAAEATPLERFTACASTTPDGPCRHVAQTYYGHPVYLRGRVSPAHPGSVGVYRMRSNSNNWVKVGTAPITTTGAVRWTWQTTVADVDNTGAYRFRFRLRGHRPSQVIRVWIIRDI